MLFPFSRSDSISDAVFGVGDLYPEVFLRWNFGVHNFMTYATGDIPVGSYSSTRLSNIGIGHGAVDAGGGYTYFNPETGHEFRGFLASRIISRTHTRSIKTVLTCTLTGAPRSS